MSRGVVAAGHPLTAEAGAWALREGGNAVDAAVAAVLTSFVDREPADRPRRGRVHARPHAGRGRAARLLRRRAAASTARRAAPSWCRSRSTSAPTRPGLQRRRRVVRRAGHRRAGLRRRCDRFGTMPLAELVAPGGRARPRRRRDQRAAGLPVRDPGADPDPRAGGAGRSMRQAGGCSAEGERVRVRRARATRSSGSGPRDRSRSIAVRSRPRSRDWVLERGGTLAAPTSPPTSRSPASRSAPATAGCEMLTNPPPSSGGVLIAYALELLSGRAGGVTDPRSRASSQ